ncbi:unnamed protein product [Schistosoma intercalatum]|nr:unnamed protein product [Schistosoma intercalatum]
MNINLNICNVTITGLAFFFLFAAFQTASLTAQNVLEAVSKQRNNSFDGTGYTSNCVYLIWFIQLVCTNYCNVSGRKIFYDRCLYIASYIEPFEWSLYSASFVNGIGAAVLWTAQGAFITDCSTKSNLNQHFSLFWGLFQANQIVGGLYAYLSLSNIDEISRTLRIRLYGGLLGCAIFGILLLFTLRKPHKTDNISHQQLINMEINSSGDNLSELTPDYSTIQNRSTVFQSTLHSLRKSVKILITRPMICILVAAAFTGINLTFYSSLYASALGHCLHFGRNAKSYIGLAGLFIGIGEIIGSFSSHLTRWIRLEGVLVIFGYISAIVAGYFTFMMLPTNSSIKDTDELSYITPNVYLAMLIAFLFGGVDSVWNTQISTLIGFIYGEHGRDVTVGFALFKSVQSIVSGIAFVYSTYLLLHWQILIFVVMATSGLYCLLSVYRSHLSRSVNLIA